MFYLLLLVITALLTTVTYVTGSRRALLLAVAICVVVPNWLLRDVGALVLDLRVATGLIALLCLLFDARHRWQYQFVVADALAILLTLSAITSESLNDGAAPSKMLAIACQWLLPCALGRFALVDTRGLYDLNSSLAATGAMLGLYAAIEAVTRVNVAHWVGGFGGSLQGLTDIRWGMKRAEGNLTHPIFFGLSMVLLLPWALSMAQRARRGESAQRWRLAPWLTACGAIFSMSRGPQLALIATWFSLGWFRARAWRGVLATLAVAAALTAYSTLDLIVNVFHAWSGETAHETIDIHGQTYSYSGTQHRLLQLIVYQDALAAAGWFGYGSAPLSQSVTAVPFVEDHLRPLFTSIDNHYLHFTLQSGWVGIGSFVCLSLSGIVYLFRRAGYASTADETLAAAQCGAIASCLGMLFTVWFAADFGFVWLLMLGLIAGDHALRLGHATAQLARHRATLAPRRLRFADRPRAADALITQPC